MKNKFGIKIGHYVEFTGTQNLDCYNNRIKGRVIDFHSSGRALVITHGGHRWMFPLHFLIKLDKNHVI
jgi:hypothetical protein